MFLIKGLIAGQYFVMDNAFFHKSKSTRELIESVGCKVIFLPPYSLDLNSIEKFWANSKRCIQDKITHFDTLYYMLIKLVLLYQIILRYF